MAPKELGTDLIDFLDEREELLGVMEAEERLREFYWAFMSTMKHALSEEAKRALEVAQLLRLGKAPQAHRDAIQSQCHGRLREIAAPADRVHPLDANDAQWIEYCTLQCIAFCLDEPELKYKDSYDIANEAAVFLWLANQIEDHWANVEPLLRKHFA